MASSYSFRNMQKSFSAFDASISSFPTGNAVKSGILDTFGWHFEMGKTGKMTNEGFLGLGPSRTGRAFSAATKYNRSGFLAAGKAMTRSARQVGFRASAKAVGGAAWKGIGLASTLAMAYSGYQDEGIWGATKGLAEAGAWNVAMHMAPAAFEAMSPLGALYAAGQAGYAIGEAGRAHNKGLRQLELGGAGKIMDALSSAGAATSRQRSLSALNNTHLNGRMALGNEAVLTHRQF